MVNVLGDGARDDHSVQVRVVEQLSVVGVEVVGMVVLGNLLGHILTPAGNSMQTGVGQSSNVASANLPHQAEAGKADGKFFGHKQAPVDSSSGHGDSYSKIRRNLGELVGIWRPHQFL